jgi:hypothetical protein
MKKRSLAAFLWFMGGWTLGSTLAFFAGLPWGLGPGLAVLLAAVAWWDPAGLLWPNDRKVHGQAVRASRRPISPVFSWTISYVGGSTLDEEFPGGSGNGVLRLDTACAGPNTVCSP